MSMIKLLDTCYIRKDQACWSGFSKTRGMLAAGSAQNSCPVWVSSIDLLSFVYFASTAWMGCAYARLETHTGRFGLASWCSWCVPSCLYI